MRVRLFSIEVQIENNRFGSLLFAIAGCGNSSIVGKWRMSGGSMPRFGNFQANGAVLVGDVRGRYKFGDQDRIKIETPFATTVYQLTISGDQMMLRRARRCEARVYKDKSSNS